MSNGTLIEFRHLRFFVVVAEEGNLTVAAGRLNTTQPNLSTQIKQLEGILGTDLLERDYDGVSLTPSGHVLLAGAYEALQLQQDILDMLEAMRTQNVDALKLGFSPLSATRFRPSSQDVASRSSAPRSKASNTRYVEAISMRD